MATEVESPVLVEEPAPKTEEEEPSKPEENHVDAEETKPEENEVQSDEVTHEKDEAKEDGGAEGNGSVPPAEEKVKFACPVPTQEIPNPVLNSLMLETFLRMAKIPFDRVHQKKVKYVFEYKGEKSTNIETAIDSLTNTFSLTMDAWMSPLDKAYARCIFTTILESTFWSLEYYRWVDNYKNTKKSYANSLPPVMNVLSPKLFQNKIKKQVEAHGLCGGDYVYERAIDDLKAFSLILGERPFLMGEEPASVDAALFSLLASVTYSCPESKQAELMKQEEYSNLAKYVERMKQDFWLDWDELCGSESELSKKKGFFTRLSSRKSRSKSSSDKQEGEASPTEEQPPASPEKEKEEGEAAAAEEGGEDKGEEEGAKTEETENTGDAAAEGEEKKEEESAEAEEPKEETPCEEKKEEAAE